MIPEHQEILKRADAGATFSQLVSAFSQSVVMTALGNNGYLWDRDGSIHKKAEEPDEPEPESKDAAEEEEDADGYPALLPIAGMPGYLVDAFGVPHAVKKRGTKGGPVKPDRYWRKRTDRGPGARPAFICGFRIRVNGVRKRYRPTYFHMARKIAEQKWENAG
jgi:hypothetical protein